MVSLNYGTLVKETLSYYNLELLQPLKMLLTAMLTKLVLSSSPTSRISTIGLKKYNHLLWS